VLEKDVSWAEAVLVGTRRTDEAKFKAETFRRPKAPEGPKTEDAA
jgi:hypothetical protein